MHYQPEGLLLLLSVSMVLPNAREWSTQRKCYLVPCHQLDKLKAKNTRKNIQVLENYLDLTIKNILLWTNLDQYEKAKLYSNILTMFLTVIKQGDRESSVLILSLPQTSDNHKNKPSFWLHVNTAIDREFSVNATSGFIFTNVHG